MVATVAPVTCLDDALDWNAVSAASMSTSCVGPGVAAGGVAVDDGVGALEDGVGVDGLWQLGDGEVDGRGRVVRVVVGVLGRDAGAHLVAVVVEDDDAPLDGVAAEWGGGRHVSVGRTRRGHPTFMVAGDRGHGMMAPSMSAFSVHVLAVAGQAEAAASS